MYSNYTCNNTAYTSSCFVYVSLCILVGTRRLASALFCVCPFLSVSTTINQLDCFQTCCWPRFFSLSQKRPFILRLNMDLNPSDQVWCSNCKKFRDPASFEKTKYGKERKTCNRHGKRRNIDVVFDNWGIFEEQLAAWNCPV
jgi:hypothetical protein